MAKNHRAKQEARERQAATGEKYTTAHVSDPVFEVDDDSDFDDYGARGIDDDSGFGPDSYFAHTMAKDD